MYMYGHHQVVLVSVICLHKTHCLNEFISTCIFLQMQTYPYNEYIYIQKHRDTFIHMKT